MRDRVRRLLQEPDSRRELLDSLPALADWPPEHRSLLWEDMLLRNGPWALEMLERAWPDDAWLVALLERLAHTLQLRGELPGLACPETASAAEQLELFRRIAHAPNPILAASQPVAPAPEQRLASSEREWTVLVYSNQFDSDLFAFHDLKAAEANLDPERASVLYRMRRVDASRVADSFKRHHWVTWADANWSGVRTFQVQASRAPYYLSGSPVLSEGPDAELDDTRHLSEFIRWGVREFPARRYCLSLWNHGSHVKGPSLVEGCTLPGSVDRFGRDLRDGWRAAAGSGRKLDLLILNGCNLASTELLYELSEVAQFAFATQTRNNVPGDAFLYEMLSRPQQMTTRETLLAYFEDFVSRSSQAYARNGIDTALAASAIDLERLRNLAGSMGDLASALLDEPGRDDREWSGLLPAEEPEFCGFEFDLGDVVRRLAGRAGRVGERARAVLELHETPSRGPVLAHHANARLPHLSGLNLYVKSPATVALVDRLWRDAKKPGWDATGAARLGRDFSSHPYHNTLFAREVRWGPALLHLFGR